MKFKIIIAALLVALIGLNAVSVGLIYSEEKKQTEIALAEYDAVSYAALIYIDGFMINNPHIDIGDNWDWFMRINEQRREYGLD